MVILAAACRLASHLVCSGLICLRLHVSVSLWAQSSQSFNNNEMYFEAQKLDLLGLLKVFSSVVKPILSCEITIKRETPVFDH